jgi:uncharacterized protein YceK
MKTIGIAMFVMLMGGCASYRARAEQEADMKAAMVRMSKEYCSYSGDRIKHNTCPNPQCPYYEQIPPAPVFK